MLAEAAFLITFAGLGPVELGMSPVEAQRASGIEVRLGPCGEVRLGSYARQISLVVVDSRIRMIHVGRRRSGRTVEGVQVGDGVRKLRRAYGERLHARRTGRYRPVTEFALYQRRRVMEFAVDKETRRITRISTGFRRIGGEGTSCAQPAATR